MWWFEWMVTHEITNLSVSINLKDDLDHHLDSKAELMKQAVENRVKPQVPIRWSLMKIHLLIILIAIKVSMKFPSLKRAIHKSSDFGDNFYLQYFFK